MKKTGQKPKNEPQEALGRPASKSGQLAILIIIVCAIVSATHWPALSAKAIFFDDDLYLTDNVLVQNPSWSSARRFLAEVWQPSTVYGYYQPLTMISLMVDHALGGRKDYLMPFHRTSLALHAANTALVIVLLYLLFGEALMAAAVGLLFGLHPMTVEAIPWVGERKTLLAAFFALWCLILYVLYCRRSDWKLYAGCVVTYVLAVMSKPISVPLPALMLLMDFWPLRRLKWRSIVEKLPLFLIAGIFAYITIVSQGLSAAVTMPREHGPVHIVLTLCHNIIFYLYKVIWPVNMSSYYVFPEPMGLSQPMVLAGVVGTCILIPLLLISLLWTRAVLTGWLIFFVSIFPTMGVIGFTIVIAADKFAYLPSVGIMMTLTCFLCLLCGTSDKRRASTRFVVVIGVLILAAAEAVATRRGLSYWRDTETLYKRMLTTAPDAVPMHFNLATELRVKGKTDEVVSHYRRILQLDPAYYKAHQSLGLILELQGKIDEAIEIFRQGLNAKQNDAGLRICLGEALESKGMIDKAITHYRYALKVKPERIWDKVDYTRARLKLANALKKKGKVDEVIELYRQILKAKPKYAEVYTSLANALSEKGKSDEAIENYRRALGLNPKSALRHTNLAWELKSAKQYNEALEHFSEALRLEPDWLSGLCGMAQVLVEHPDLKLRDANKAVALGRRAAKLTKYQDAIALETLATAYQALGQSDQAATILSDFGYALGQQGKVGAAIKYYKKAIELSPNFTIAHGWLGLALAQQNKTDEAIKEFRIVVRQQPDDVEMYCNIGILLEKQGKVSEAIKEYQQALKYNPDHARAGKLLQVALTKQKNKEM